MSAMNDVLRAAKATLSSPAWLCFTWFGMTAGVSVLATPARFSAELITRPIAFDVTATVFAVLNKAELIALILLLIIVRVSGRAKHWWAFCGVLTLLLIAQSTWLLPELTERAAMVAAGRPLPESIVHSAYTTTELIKLALLFGAGIMATAGSKETA